MTLHSLRQAVPSSAHLDSRFRAIAAVVGLLIVAWTGRGLLGVQASFAALTNDRSELEANLSDIPLLESYEIALLRRSLNDRHVELASELGISPVAQRSSLDSVAHALQLAHVESGWRYNTLSATHSIPWLTRDAAASLDSISTRFAERLDERDVPPFKFTLSSILRSSEDQARLRRSNSNAADGNSSHEFATTYDITYRRFEPAMGVLPAPRVDDRVPVALRPVVSMALAAQQRENLESLSNGYSRQLQAELGRSLIELEDDGVVAVIRERSQPVFHVTVAKHLAGQ